MAGAFGGFLAFLQQHLQNWLEDLSQPVLGRLGLLLGVVDVFVGAVAARHAVFTGVR